MTLKQHDFKKPIFLLFALGMTCLTVSAQLKAKPPCGPFSVDLINGMVDNVKPNFNVEQIKQRFPCFTSEDTDTSGKCGSALFYQGYDIKFFIKRQYVEIGPTFKGKLSLPIMGAARSAMFQYFGNPRVKDTGWDAFEMSYGTLVLHYNPAGKVNLIQFATRTTDELNLCE